MARQCQRAGCKELVTQYNARFHSKECQAADYRERKAALRDNIRKGHRPCPVCGRRASRKEHPCPKVSAQGK